MRHLIPLITLCLVSLLWTSCGGDHHHDHDTADHDHDHVSSIEELKIENLLRDSLGLAEDLEVVISYIEMPDGTDLPPHWHPGEEFVYMLQGSGELTLEGDEKLILQKGDVYKIPLKMVHSFQTLEEDARAVVFRVHEKGQPDRILVE